MTQHFLVLRQFVTMPVYSLVSLNKHISFNLLNTQLNNRLAQSRFI